LAWKAKAGNLESVSMIDFEDSTGRVQIMNADYLQNLNDAVEQIERQKTFSEIVEGLKKELNYSEEPFVWSVLDLDSVNCALPERIKSGWVFVLKRDVPSGRHYHPNSVQHMVMIEGQGQSCVGNVRKEMVRFGTPGQPPETVWYVINEGVPHEFFPEETEMVVVSFHTCEARELEEVACGSGAERLYLG
jgi:oxalate decarboxylase/phosphoglucose isomerase-like protein (cupin superfamily)